jgi:acetate kinase
VTFVDRRAYDHLAMRVLTLNSGSSSLKFETWEADQDGLKRLSSGALSGLGGASTELTLNGSSLPTSGIDANDPASLLILLRPHLGSIDAVAHRVVHGGALQAPAVINEAVLAAIEAATELAPLHNGPALTLIRSAQSLFAGLPQVAVFDTTFHKDLPPRASTYAIDRAMAERHSIRRYGFHGLAHQDMSRRWASLSGRDLASSRLITLQLGSGCSVTAIRDGRSIDTSMGFTPLEGLVMEMRSGDLDPSIALYLMAKEGLTADAVQDLLNHRSGLLGMAGRRDMRELLAAESAGDEHARLAIDVFVYRLQKYIGAYLTVLGSADAVVFGGGIGENSPVIRHRIIEALGWMSVKLDHNRNTEAQAIDARISADDSTIEVWTVAVNESRILAEEAITVLKPDWSTKA